MWTDRHAVLVAPVLVVGVLAVSARVNADAFTPGNHGFLDTGGSFTQLDVPGATSTFAQGINDAGQIVGWYYSSPNPNPHGFLDTGASFTHIDVPPINSANAIGINGAAQIVGGASLSGFLYSAGNFAFITAGFLTSASGINDAGQIVGSYTNNPRDGGVPWHGFLDTAGNITTFDVPGANSTFANGINGSGQIVGSYSNNTDTHGFLDTGGSFTQIDVPGATSTEASGINDAGQIVGSFTNSTGTHGFLDTGGSFIQIDVPGATSTEASGINDAGQIVGSTFVSGGTGDPHFTTYSGINYDFQGVGDFLLARSNLAGDQFDVEIRTGAWSNATSVIEGAAATLCNHKVTFDVDRAATGSSLIWLDGSPISLSVGGPGLALGACKIFESSSMQYQLVWDTGETLDITDYGTSLAVSSQLSSIDGPGSVDGLLASEIDPDRWRVAGTVSLFDPVPEPTTLSLLSMGIGLTGIAVMRRHRTKGTDHYFNF